MPHISRRTLLQLTASSIPLLAMGCAGPVVVEDIPESLARFPRTPISGDMSEDRAVLTFFVADDSPVTLWVWNDDGLVLDRAVASNGDGFHKVMLDALEPGTRYHWAVLGGEGPRYEDRSLVCSFRTAYADR